MTTQWELHAVLVAGEKNGFSFFGKEREHLQAL